MVWTFIRLAWGEWSSRVTGSLSALLVALGLGINLAGAVGYKIPSDPFIQLGTWLLAAVCGGQAAYSVWKREHLKVLELTNKITPTLTLLYNSEDENWVIIYLTD